MEVRRVVGDGREVEQCGLAFPGGPVMVSETAPRSARSSAPTPASAPAAGQSIEYPKSEQNRLTLSISAG